MKHDIKCCIGRATSYDKQKKQILFERLERCPKSRYKERLHRLEDEIYSMALNRSRRFIKSNLFFSLWFLSEKLCFKANIITMLLRFCGRVGFIWPR